MRLLLAILALGVLEQEVPLSDLVQKLEDDHAEARDKAEKDLCALGEAALPQLKEAVDSPRSSGELKLRAAAVIREIEWSVKAAKVYREPARITVRASDTALLEVLAEVARQAGVKIDSRFVDESAKVTLMAREATLFQTLDLLCGGQEERTWEARDEGIRFQKERHVAYPSDYLGPFRVRVQSMNVERSNDFKARTSALTVTLDADCERQLKPLKNIELEIARASDDRGSTLEITPVNPNLVVLRGAPGARLVVRGGMTPAELQESVHTFTLKGLALGALRVAVEGVARFVFPLEPREFTIDRPAAAETRELGDTTVRLTRGGTPETWTLSFHRAPSCTTPAWAQSIVQRFDPDSFAVVDQDGAPLSVNLRPMGFPGRARMDPSSEIAVWYQGDAQRSSTKPIKDVKFKFADQVLLKAVPFKFTGLELP